MIEELVIFVFDLVASAVGALLHLVWWLLCVPWRVGVAVFGAKKNS